MGTIALKCKSCSGTLEIDEEREVLCCPFCGSKEIFEDSDEVKKARIETKAYKEIKLGALQLKRQMRLDEDQLEANKEKRKEEKERRDLKLGLKILLGEALFILLMVAVLAISSGVHRLKGDVQPPISAKASLGEDYRLIVDELHDALFNNVIVQTYEDDPKVYNITHISIDGDADFSTSDWFPKDATVRITYGIYEPPENVIE